MKRTLLDIINSHKIIAHRGCWDSVNPENSLASMQVAVDKGYAIEIDVYLLQDGTIAVFHDSTLERMCGVNVKIDDLTAKDLKSSYLKETKQYIPNFEEFLEVIDGLVPIYIELKGSAGIALCDALIEATQEYTGEYIFIGFSESNIKYLHSKGYMTCMSKFIPKMPSFTPDGMLCNVLFVPSSAKRRAKFPPLIPWTVNTVKRRKSVETKCIASIYNTHNFEDLR